MKYSETKSIIETNRVNVELQQLETSLEVLGLEVDKRLFSDEITYKKLSDNLIKVKQNLHSKKRVRSTNLQQHHKMKTAEINMNCNPTPKNINVFLELMNENIKERVNNSLWYRLKAAFHYYKYELTA